MRHTRIDVILVLMFCGQGDDSCIHSIRILIEGDVRIIRAHIGRRITIVHIALCEWRAWYFAELNTVGGQLEISETVCTVFIGGCFVAWDAVSVGVEQVYLDSWRSTLVRNDTPASVLCLQIDFTREIPQNLLAP